MAFTSYKQAALPFKLCPRGYAQTGTFIILNQAVGFSEIVL